MQVMMLMVGARVAFDKRLGFLSNARPAAKCESAEPAALRLFQKKKKLPREHDDTDPRLYYL